MIDKKSDRLSKTHTQLNWNNIEFEHNIPQKQNINKRRIKRATKRAIWSETIRWPSVWIKTNHQNIEGICSKGKKCNKTRGRYRTRVWLKSNERIWLRTSVADKSSATWLCKLYLRTAAAETRSPTFRFTFTYNVYSFHIFIRFPSPSSFCSVLKVAEQCRFPRAVFAASRILARGFFLLLLYLRIFLYLSSFLFFNTF